MANKKFTDLEVTDEEFKEIINNSHEIVIVDFFAEWCMPCLMITPIIRELSEELKNVKFAKINIDDNQELAQKHNISSIPCLIIFKNGEEIDRITGSQPKYIIEKKIKNYLK